MINTVVTAETWCLMLDPECKIETDKWVKASAVIPPDLLGLEVREILARGYAARFSEEKPDCAADTRLMPEKPQGFNSPPVQTRWVNLSPSAKDAGYDRSQ